MASDSSAIVKILLPHQVRAARSRGSETLQSNSMMAVATDAQVIGYGPGGLVGRGSAGGVQVVTPGQLITDDQQFMKGHGVYSDYDDPARLHSGLQGIVERVNKLVSVRGVRARYSGNIGDVVIGRVTEVNQRRWRVDINAHQDAALQLSSISLPGGIQRRKSESDELAMRSFFVEGDLVVAEVHVIHQADQSLGLHARSSKYGKLKNGTLVCVPSHLVQRCKTHFCKIPSCGVHLILGMNGRIWVGAEVPTEETVHQNMNTTTNSPVPAANQSTQNTVNVSVPLREAIARVSNCIRVMAQLGIAISDASVACAYELSLPYSMSDDDLRLALAPPH